jgi:tetratricopeptide (TPR) repeat protein
MHLRVAALQRVAAVLIFICGVGLWGRNQAVEGAWNLAARGDRAGAITILRDVVRREPRNADVHLFLGSLLVEENQREDALAQLKEAVGLRPDWAEALNALAEGYLHFGQPAAAREYLDRAAKLDPKSGIVETNLGSALLQLGDPKGAGEHLDKALRLSLSPADQAEAHYLRAKVCNVQRDAEQTRSHLERAVALRPDFAEAWSDLGMARKASLEDAAALAAFKRATELDPKDAVAQYRLGAEYLRQEKPAEAIAALEAASKLSPDDQSTLNALQSALRQVGRTEEAAAVKRQLAEVLRKRDQGSQEALKALRLNNQGAELEKNGHLAEAVELYRQAVALNPEHAGMRVNYAVALLRLGRWTEGLTELHRALERDPDNTQIQLAWKDALAQAPRRAVPAWAKEGKQ